MSRRKTRISMRNTADSKVRSVAIAINLIVKRKMQRLSELLRKTSGNSFSRICSSLSANVLISDTTARLIRSKRKRPSSSLKTKRGTVP